MEMPVIAAWDAVVRAWLVARTWLALRRASHVMTIERLAHIADPARFVRAAIAPAAGHVALAIALLPRRRRGEATITLLACKALLAFDAPPGRAGREAVTSAVTYLTGEAQRVPPIATGGASRLDALLAARLPVLRAALEALPGDAVRRCRAMIERTGEAVLRARDERDGGSAHVLGEAVIYAARLAAPSVRAPDTTCRAAGRALQRVDELRAAKTAEARSRLASPALSTLPDVARMACWLPASAGPGTRAAVALLVITSCAAALRLAGGAIPRRVHHPLRAALAAAWSRGAYLAVVAAVDVAICDALAARPLPCEAPAVAPVEPLVAHGPAGSGPTVGSLAIELVPRRNAEAAERDYQAPRSARPDPAVPRRPAA